MPFLIVLIQVKGPRIGYIMLKMTIQPLSVYGFKGRYIFNFM